MFALIQDIVAYIGELANPIVEFEQWISLVNRCVEIYQEVIPLPLTLVSTVAVTIFIIKIVLGGSP